MSNLSTYLAIGGFIVLLGFAVQRVRLMLKSKLSLRPATSVSSPNEVFPTAAVKPLAVVARELPSEIHFGADPGNPVVTMRPLPLAEVSQFEATPHAPMSKGVSSRISALMQAAPSIMVAEAHHGRQIMEVVINSPLVRASDGNGFRAMARGVSGIKEHARLYEVGDLTNLVNAAAVWQLASVVVAQKHMADISQKLTEIKDGISQISEHLDGARRGVLQGTYQYLEQVHLALTEGELPQAVRFELESCERELLAVQNHLIAECRSRALKMVNDDDMTGTESLHKNGVAKYVELNQVCNDLDLCVKTRVLAWYVLSLYPGEQSLKSARQSSIRQSLAELESVRSFVSAQCSKDLERFKSIWNFNDKLEARKSDVRTASRRVEGLLTDTKTGVDFQIARTEQLLIARDIPTKLFIEMIDGKVTHTRQMELMAT